MLNTVDVQNQKYYNQNYSSNPNLIRQGDIVDGEKYFYRGRTVKDMAIHKVNKSLTGLLILAVVTMFVSYYFILYNQLKLDVLSKEIQALNTKNVELQNHLDRAKSLTNVDAKMSQTNLLKRADNVVELSYISVVDDVKVDTITPNPFKWSIGY